MKMYINIRNKLSEESHLSRDISRDNIKKGKGRFNTSITFLAIRCIEQRNTLTRILVMVYHLIFFRIFSVNNEVALYKPGVTLTRPIFLNI